jgi:hypothetical protein
MTLDLQQFTSLFKNKDIARSNLFRVHVHPGSKVLNGAKIGMDNLGHAHDKNITNNFKNKSISLQNSESLSLLADGVIFPSNNIETVEGTGFHEFPTGYKKSTLDIKFILDSEMMAYSFFHEWMNNIIDPYTRKYGFLQDFIGNIVIETFDNRLLEDSPSSTWEFLEVYPINIGTLTYDWGAITQTTSIDVKFEFRTYYMSSNATYLSDSKDIKTAVTNVKPLNTPTNTSAFPSNKLGDIIKSVRANKKDITGLNGINNGISGAVGSINAIINANITQPLNAVNSLQRTISSNIQKLRLPISNTNAQVNVIKSFPKNINSIGKTIKF